MCQETPRMQDFAPFTLQPTFFSLARRSPPTFSKYPPTFESVESPDGYTWINITFKLILKTWSTVRYRYKNVLNYMYFHVVHLNSKVHCNPTINTCTATCTWINDPSQL